MFLFFIKIIPHSAGFFVVKEVTGVMENPHLGIDREWKIAPKVTLLIDEENGVIVEKRIEDGLEPKVIATIFEAPSEADEHAVLEATTF